MVTRLLYYQVVKATQAVRHSPVLSLHLLSQLYALQPLPESLQLLVCDMADTELKGVESYPPQHPRYFEPFNVVLLVDEKNQFLPL